MNKPKTWSGQDHSEFYREFYPQENQPKYQIGDTIPGTQITVCGLMTTSTGMHKYFLQIDDNSLVVDDENIEATIFILTKKN